MEKQLRRYKRRLKDHHTSDTTPVETFDAPSYTARKRRRGESMRKKPDDACSPLS